MADTSLIFEKCLSSKPDSKDLDMSKTHYSEALNI